MAITKQASRVSVPPVATDHESPSSSSSDDLDLSQSDAAGRELCQVGDQRCTLPLDLYDLPDLTSILSVEVWNELLSEEERFALAEHLPDMSHDDFARTLSELFSGANFHFGSPLALLFEQLKGGLCDPRLVVYRQGVNFFQRQQYYHYLRKYHDSMVGTLVGMRDAWRDCEGYGTGDMRFNANSENGGLESPERLVSRRPELGCRSPKVSASKGCYDSVTHWQYARQNQIAGFGSGTGRRVRRADYDESRDQGYEMNMRGDWDTSRMSAVGGDSLLKQGKKHEKLKRRERDARIRYGDEEDIDGYAGSPHYNGRRQNTYQDVTVASYNRLSHEAPKKAKYSEDWIEHEMLRGAQVEWLPGSRPIQQLSEFRSSKGKNGPDSKFKSYEKFPPRIDDLYLRSGHRGNEKIRSKSAQHSRSSPVFAPNEEMESDSSDQVKDDADINPLVGKMGYPSGTAEGRQPIAVKSEAYTHLVNGGKAIHAPSVETYSMKVNLKGSINESGYSHGIKSMKKGQVPHHSDKLQPLSLKTYATERNWSGMTDLDNSSHQSNHMHDYDSSILNVVDDDLDRNSKIDTAHRKSNKIGNRSQTSDSHAIVAGHHKIPDTPLLGCNTVTQKRKAAYLDGSNECFRKQPSLMKQSDELDLLKKKGKRKADFQASSVAVVIPESVEPEKGTRDIELEMKAQQKSFSLITPSIHTGFSFSIIHLLSAIRKAMVTHVEDTASIGSHLEKDDRRQKLRKGQMLQAGSSACPSNLCENIDVNTLESAGQDISPSLTVQEIVGRVRSNPGDPCILETQEPLQDLVRGVLKIFASKTAPLGAKGWKALVFYEKSTKSWSWVGPVFAKSPDSDAAEEETSSEAWGIPHRMLAKLVDAFANWLKSDQETLKQIGSLPIPPIVMFPNLDEKERFKDLRAQKSLNTISPTTGEMREYFRTEERLRYSVPDRAFSYTAYDGKKSIVAPLRRGGGKPTSKARDHVMLKLNRPPHVTVLCLVRDAAARLPGSVGTRADVCTLIRDSQYIVEDVSDAQVNQTVSGALDRLHYERDPCVQFDGDRKLWVYLHRDREEEDFEDDGTSSMKKWKRQKKDPTDNSDTAAVKNLSYSASEDPAEHGSAGFELNHGTNIQSSSARAGRQTKLIYNGLRPNTENIESYIDSTQGDRRKGNWQAFGLSPLQENRMVRQQNSSNEESDDEAFSGESPVRLFKASLF